MIGDKETRKIYIKINFIFFIIFLLTPKKLS